MFFLVHHINKIWNFCFVFLSSNRVANVHSSYVWEWVSYSLRFWYWLTLFFFFFISYYFGRGADLGRQYIFILLFTMRRNCKLCNRVLNYSYIQPTTNDNDNDDDDEDFDQRENKMQLCYYLLVCLRVLLCLLFSSSFVLPSTRIHLQSLTYTDTDTHTLFESFLSF